jgi:hypothetical protein
MLQTFDLSEVMGAKNPDDSYWCLAGTKSLFGILVRGESEQILFQLRQNLQP